MPPEIDRATTSPPPEHEVVSASDAELLRRYARQADEAAFATLVRRHIGLVYSAATRQLDGDRSQAEDVTQAVFTELARHGGRLEKHPALAGWLFTTTRRIACAARRTERRREQRELAYLAMEHPSESTDQGLEAPAWDAMASVLDDALHELNERDRTAVVLRFFQSRPFAEVGQALGLSGNAARMRVDRALDRLRDRLTRRGIDSTSAALAAALTAHAVQAVPAGLSGSIATASMAAAAGASIFGTSSFFTTMITLKTKFALGALAVSLVAVPFVLQNRNVRQLRQELAEANAARLALVDAEAEARRAAELATAESRRLQEAQTELMRLRGEIGPLRDQVRALTRAPAPALLPAARRAPEAEPRSRQAELSDVGAVMAENAAASLIWAVSAGRMDRLAELLELPAGVTSGDAPRHFEFFANQLSNVFRGLDFDGWKMDLKGTTNEDIVRLDYGYRDLESGKDEIFPFFLRRFDNGWKVLVEGAVPEKF
ncbi:MAG: sigma-70 family RNA polymerase sigma factor [Verrucomicrobiales bacterium]|nr:sigma-70 family RNA polymerase sigma factor [Verrucomicrobiales bacterium]